MPSAFTMSAHHLIWTHRDFGKLDLRHHKAAIIRIPLIFHNKLHRENEPFKPLSTDAIELLNMMLAAVVITRHEEVLRAFRLASQELLQRRDGITEEDCAALAHNIQLTQVHQLWLERYVPYRFGCTTSTQPNQQKGGGKKTAKGRSARPG